MCSLVGTEPSLSDRGGTSSGSSQLRACAEHLKGGLLPKALGISQHLLVSLPCLFSHWLHAGCLLNRNKKTMIAKGPTLAMGVWLRRKLRAQGQGQTGAIPTISHSPVSSGGASPRHRRQPSRQTATGTPRLR